MNNMLNMNEERKMQCPYCLYDIPMDEALKHMNKCGKQDMRYIKRNPERIR